MHTKQPTSNSKPSQTVQEQAETLLCINPADVPTVSTRDMQALVSALLLEHQQVQQSEQRYHRLTDAVIDYVFTVRVDDGRTVETVHGLKCEAITGYTPGEFASNDLLWIAIIPEEDRERVELHVQQTLNGEQPPPLEHRIRRKDGAVRWVLRVTSAQLNAEGRVIAYDGLLRDVTASKQAAEKLQQLNTTLEQRVTEQTGQIWLQAQAIAHLGEGVVITEDELDWPGPRIVFVNDAVCRITGYSADELIGQTPRILQGADSNRDKLQRLKADLAAGHSTLGEFVNYRKDGTPYDAELFITPLFDAAGRRRNFVSIHRDISARKAAERAMQEREERLQAILDTAADAIITIDERGVVNSVNAATVRMFGYSQEELVGQNVNILMPSPYREEHDGYIARYLKTGEARIIGLGREAEGRHKNGSIFPIDVAVSKVDHIGLFTGIIRDITDRKVAEKASQREQAFSESIINTARNIVLVLDTDGCIVRFNTYLEELTGWQLDEVRGRDWIDVFLPQRDRHRIRELLTKAIRGERTRGNINSIRAKDGREFEIEWYDAPLNNAEGQSIGLICTGLDITERQHLQREILEIAAAEQRRIGGDLHDSVGQELTGAGLLADTLLTSLRRNNRHEAELAERLAARVKSSLTQVRALARGLNPVDVDGRGLMLALEELTTRIRDLHTIDVTFVCAEPVHFEDNQTATQLFRISQEATTNAIRHAAPTEIQICLDRTNAGVVLRVRDNGSGFQPMKDPLAGTGLRIMSYRAGLIGAQLSVEPAEGSGTIVTCLVPVRDV